MCIVSVRSRNWDISEESVHFSSISSAGALNYEVEGTVANYWDILFLVHITIIKDVIAKKSQSEKYNRGCTSFHVFRQERSNRPLTTVKEKSQSQR
jgi:hypothetical protein